MVRETLPYSFAELAWVFRLFWGLVCNTTAHTQNTDSESLAGGFGLAARKPILIPLEEVARLPVWGALNLLQRYFAQTDLGLSLESLGTGPDTDGCCQRGVRIGSQALQTG